MKAPIIFCHYGNSDYLPYVFEVARKTNPDKDIILLGDKDNKWLENSKNINHYFFKDYDYGKELETFEQVYTLVQGVNHNNVKGGKDWVNFVFKRWFYIYNFLIKQGIDSFWHFDSDNMILVPLGAHEEKFKTYDCTEQCNGSCMNGYISDPLIVLKYIRKINELFQDKNYLKEQMIEFENVNLNYAFTEMRAYDEFKKEINSIKLNSVIDGSSFDDCICQEHNMEMESLYPSKIIKKVYFRTDGSVYCFDTKNQSFVRMNSLNLSWVPLDVFKIISNQVGKNLNNEVSDNKDFSQMVTLGREFFKRNFIKVTLQNIMAFLVNWLRTLPTPGK